MTICNPFHSMLCGNKKVKKEQVHTLGAGTRGGDWEKNTHEE